MGYFLISFKTSRLRTEVKKLLEESLGRIDSELVIDKILGQLEEITSKGVKNIVIDATAEDPRTVVEALLLSSLLNLYGLNVVALYVKEGDKPVNVAEELWFSFILLLATYSLGFSPITRILEIVNEVEKNIYTTVGKGKYPIRGLAKTLVESLVNLELCSANGFLREANLFKNVLESTGVKKVNTRLHVNREPLWSKQLKIALHSHLAGKYVCAMLYAREALLTFSCYKISSCLKKVCEKGEKCTDFTTRNEISDYLLRIFFRDFKPRSFATKYLSEAYGELYNKTESIIRGIFSSKLRACLLYTSPSPRDGLLSRMPSSA